MRIEHQLWIVTLVTGTLGVLAAHAGPADAADSTELQEVTVTATRQEEPLSKVPISVAAFSQEQMDIQGVKDLDDLVRLTPGLNLTRSSTTGASQIAIRGISSSAGAGTTGVYIDDTPIQVRNLGFGAGSAFPGLFDLERVEVLRGPQGTLFGAGSEGGTVRFILTEPSLTKYSSYLRAEGATTEQGGQTYETGAAFGGPIIDDVLGFRVSAYFRHNGGFIDEVTGTYKIVDPTGALYGQSVDFTRTSLEHRDVNWDNTTAVRMSLKYAPNESLTLTPAFFYQKLHDNDGTGAAYGLSNSDVGDRDYARQVYYAGNPATNPLLTELISPQNQSGDDQFTLTSLAVHYKMPWKMELIANTSYFDRNNDQWYDFTRGYVQFYLSQLAGGPQYPPPGYKAMSDYINGQRNFVQEIRLQSQNADSRFNWVVGAFYAHDKQIAAQPIYVNFTQNQPEIGFGEYPGGFAVAGGAPYGPGSSALANFLGINNGPNSLDYQANWQTIEEQLAGFLQADFKITDSFKVIAGVRVSHNKLSYDAAFGGPETNGAAPFGQSVPGYPDGSFAVGTGPLTPVFPSSSTALNENATTPKIGFEYQIDDANMLYATAAKGFRPAGASLKVPTVCAMDLQIYGYVDGKGNSTQPSTYGSDTVWSYELGSKNRLFDNRLVLDGSVYVIKWKKIQTDVTLPDCGYDFVDNLANATSKGFDLSVQGKPIPSLTLGMAIGYNQATFDGTAASPSGVVLFAKGAAIPDAGAPWTGSLTGEYVRPIAGRNFYLHTDYTRTSTFIRTGNTEPGTPGFDPLLPPVPAYSMVNSRLGTRFGAMDVSVFVNNLFDSVPLILNRSTYYGPQDWFGNAIRPRTFGVTLTYRN